MQYSLIDLVTSVKTIRNIDAKFFEKLDSIGLSRVIDLLFYFPSNVIIRNFCKNASDLKIKQNCVITLKVLSYNKNPRTTQVICSDSIGNIVYITFFKIYKGYLEKYLPIDEDVIILGTPDLYNGIYTFNHPDKILKSNLYNSIKPIDCVYRQHQDLTSYRFSTFISQALGILNGCDIPEWLDNQYIKENNFPSFKEALNKIHNPKSFADIAEDGKNITRLAIDEMVSYHFNLFSIREEKEIKKGLPYSLSGKLTNEITKYIPFELTTDQSNAIENIKLEFLKEEESTILLQGDVGSGKTIVCFMSSLFALESGYQVSFMAPTEILALQHFKNFSDYASKLGLNVALLKGKEKASIKKKVLKDLESGDIDIIIGTHALFQDSVVFKNLGLVIIDEQHRFGVDQRLKLINKGRNPNLLLTTATPIPRTLALSLYGDIKYFDIKEKPKNRKPIITNIASKDKLPEIIEGLKRTLTKKEKVFWVCPLVEISEKLPLTSSIDRYDYLSSQLIEYATVGEKKERQLFLVHGKMTLEEKDKVLEEFKANTTGAILVATTVIEVGIDIPECNIIIIEDANHFGLAQLHQLRGRVGRSDIQGICLLLYPKETSFTAKKRLSILKESNDGFYIAEKDMEIRGYGDILGTNQSGNKIFKVTNLDEHSKYMTSCMKYAKLLFDRVNSGNLDIVKKTSIMQKIFNKDLKKEYLKNG